MIQLSQLGCIMFPTSEVTKRTKGQPVSQDRGKLAIEHPGLAADLIHKTPRMGHIANTIRYQNKEGAN